MATRVPLRGLLTPWVVGAGPTDLVGLPRGHGGRPDGDVAWREAGGVWLQVSRSPLGTERS